MMYKDTPQDYYCNPDCSYIIDPKNTPPVSLDVLKEINEKFEFPLSKCDLCQAYFGATKQFPKLELLPFGVFRQDEEEHLVIGWQL